MPIIVQGFFPRPVAVGHIHIFGRPAVPQFQVFATRESPDLVFAGLKNSFEGSALVGAKGHFYYSTDHYRGLFAKANLVKINLYGILYVQAQQARSIAHIYGQFQMINGIEKAQSLAHCQF